MSEYLNEEEQIARMRSWWDENGTALIVSIVVAVAAIIGWRWYGSHSEEQMFEASRAYSAYQSATGEAKTLAAETIARDYAGSAYHVFVLFDQAKASLDERDLPAAEARLKEVVEVGDDVLLIDLAKVRLAKIQQALDRSGEALQTLASISSEGYRAWGLEAKGDIHVARGELELAHAAYQAALESLREGDQRPILQMKLNNVAPFDGEYVKFADTLESALQEAQAALGETATPSAADSQPSAPEATSTPASDADETVE